MHYVIDATWWLFTLMRPTFYSLRTWAFIQNVWRNTNSFLDSELKTRARTNVINFFCLPDIFPRCESYFYRFWKDINAQCYKIERVFSILYSNVHQNETNNVNTFSAGNLWLFIAICNLKITMRTKYLFSVIRFSEKYIPIPHL